MWWRLHLVIVLGASLFGLVALWSATSKSPARLRLGAPALLLGCLLLIPAYEPILFFAVQGLVAQRSD